MLKGYQIFSLTGHLGCFQIFARIDDAVMDIFLHKSLSTPAGCTLILVAGRGNGGQAGEATSTARATLTNLGCPQLPASLGRVHHWLPSWGVLAVASRRGWGPWPSLDVGLPLFLLLSQASPLDQERSRGGTLAAASNVPWEAAPGRGRDRSQTFLLASKACGLNH